MNVSWSRNLYCLAQGTKPLIFLGWWPQSHLFTLLCNTHPFSYCVLLSCTIQWTRRMAAVVLVLSLYKMLLFVFKLQECLKANQVMIFRYLFMKIHCESGGKSNMSPTRFKLRHCYTELYWFHHQSAHQKAQSLAQCEYSSLWYMPAVSQKAPQLLKIASSCLNYQHIYPFYESETMSTLLRLNLIVNLC